MIFPMIVKVETLKFEAKDQLDDHHARGGEAEANCQATIFELQCSYTLRMPRLSARGVASSNRRRSASWNDLDLAHWANGNPHRKLDSVFLIHLHYGSIDVT